MNIGSKYISIELSENQQQLIENSIVRQFFIFTITWMGTREYNSSTYFNCCILLY